MEVRRRLGARLLKDRPHQRTLAAIVGILALYGVGLVLRVPQKAVEVGGSAEHADAGADSTRFDSNKDSASPSGSNQETASDEAAVERACSPAFMVAPFVLLLGAIAVLPLLSKTAHWWEHNSRKFLVAGGLAILTLVYYLGWYAFPLERHFPTHARIEPAASGLNWELTLSLAQDALFGEFTPFIVLLFALYTISGGIRVSGDLRADPRTNLTFLACGALLASLVGTTGAAMLLIRPLLETNSQRKHVAHTVVFFTFLACNCGGCLLPLGDPPLFLGYLQGVDFLWTLSLWKEWAFVNGVLLVIYAILDGLVIYPRESKKDVVRDIRQARKLKFEGLWPNGALLLGVMLAVGLLDPSKPLVGTDWRPWLYLREATLLALVAISLAFGAPDVRRANRFDFGPIVEVAVLFVGIFVCMRPALQILDARGSSLPLREPWHYFWGTGLLSSILDNAPTYLVFFESAKSLHAPGHASMPALGVPDAYLAAVSLGAVFMGANTYIGNGPNFMVKTIAEQAGVRMPSFFGYMMYSGLVLVPIFGLVTWLFFWN